MASTCVWLMKYYTQPRFINLPSNVAVKSKCPLDPFAHQYLKLQAEADGELLQGGDGDVRLQLPVAAPRAEVDHLPPETELRD